MPRFSVVHTAAFVVAITAAGAVRAQEVLTRVPREQALTPVRAFQHATPQIKVLMMGLLVAAIAALVVLVLELLRREGPPRMAYLRGLTLAGPMLGLYGACYVMLNGFLGISNVRPTPSLTVVAPGVTEALLVLGIGLFAASIAAVARWVLDIRMELRTA